MRAHDLVDDREAEAGAVGAGREERLEDARQIVGARCRGRDPRPRSRRCVAGRAAARSVTSAPGVDASAALSTRLTSTWRRRCAIAVHDRQRRGRGSQRSATPLLGQHRRQVRASSSRSARRRRSTRSRASPASRSRGSRRPSDRAGASSSSAMSRCSRRRRSSCELAAQDLDVQRDARQRRADVVRDRGGELAERGEPARVLERATPPARARRERDARREIAGDEVGVAIDQAVVDRERADQRRRRRRARARRSTRAGSGVAVALRTRRRAAARGSRRERRRRARAAATASARVAPSPIAAIRRVASAIAAAASAGSGSPWTPSRRARRSSRPASTRRSRRGYSARPSAASASGTSVAPTSSALLERARRGRTRARAIDRGAAAEHDEQRDRRDRDRLGRRRADREQLAAQHGGADHDEADQRRERGLGPHRRLEHAEQRRR